ncbi:MAG: hypothetical protein WBE25_11705 [Xanthobacteraceae bacterium]
MATNVIHFPGAPQAPPRAVHQPRPQVPSTSRKDRREVVRFAFEDRMYEAVFLNGSLDELSHVYHRVQDGRVVELRHRFSRWCEPDSMLVAAARLARQGPAKTEIDKNQAAIAGLHRRRAKLLENVAKIEATIANLERDGESATADEV